MKARLERLKNRSEQLRANGLSVSATLQLYAGAVGNQRKAKQAEVNEQEQREPASRRALKPCGQNLEPQIA